MTKRNISLFVLCLMATVALAMPAKRVVRTVKLTDGTSVNIFMTGDENYHYLTTTDGIPVVEESEGVYRLAPEMKEQHKQKWTERAKIRNAHRIAKLKKNQEENRRRKAFGQPSSYTGKKKGIVILVNFADLKYKSTSTKGEFENQFNQTGYSKNGHIGSVHDYFLDASYGKFDLEFDVYGPVTVSNNYSYYGKNDSNDNDRYPAEMVIEACKLADKGNNINWQDYDWDGDGYVDQVYVIYAGYGENVPGADENTIWPHESTLSDEQYYLGDGTGVLTLGRMKIDTYAVSPELAGSSGSTISGIGTACHEFSHCLGIPDFYDTSYEGGQGMSYFDLMDSGSYSGPNGDGEVPTGYSAYERWFAGWLDFTELDSPCFIEDMPALQDSPTAYVVYNDNNKNEYYILENRQNRGFFKYTGTDSNVHGMLVTHVDYDETAWASNTPNDIATHQRMSYISASRNYSNSFASQVFPGLRQVRELTNTSHSAYNGKLFNKNTDGSYYMNKPITNITESNGLISFTFMGGIELQTPVVKEATVVGNNGFTAHWDAVENAESYTLEVVPASNASSTLLLSEDMYSLSSVTTDSSREITSFDDYMNNEGWTGEKIYCAPLSLKMGSSKAIGKLISPLLDQPSTGTVTVVVNAKNYNADRTTLVVAIVDASGNTLKQESFSPSSVATDYTFTFSDITTDFKVKISNSASKQRAYIYAINIYDGEATEEAKRRKAASKLTIEGLTETSYTLTGLEEDSYRYRVKAIAGSATSGWSEYMIVEGVSQPISTDISTISLDTADENSETEYFTLNGARVSKPSVPGIYLVKKAGKVQKMLIGR